MLDEEVLEHCCSSNYYDEDPAPLQVVEHIELPGTYHPAVDLVEDLHVDESVEKNGVMDGLVKRDVTIEEFFGFGILNIPDIFSEEQKDTEYDDHVSGHSIDLPPDHLSHNLVAFLDRRVQDDSLVGYLSCKS